VQASEHGDLAQRLARLGDVVERNCNVDAICAAAQIPTRHARACPGHPRLHGEAEAKTWMAGTSPAMTDSTAGALPPPGQRIALASDAAFSFMYAHLLAGWRRAGAEIFPFSPLADEPPPEGCDACWLPGGYPELHAVALAQAHKFRDGLARFAASRPVHGECGGYMVLGEFLEDAAGLRHPMTALLGHATSFAKRRLHLGYRAARLLAASPIGAAGARVRGHEFHHAVLLTPGDDAPLAEIADAQGRAVAETGSRRGNVTGTFFHVIARE
jgi:cobyrinic acid a,c-diamide synthase